MSGKVLWSYLFPETAGRRVGGEWPRTRGCAFMIQHETKQQTALSLWPQLTGERGHAANWVLCLCWLIKLIFTGQSFFHRNSLCSFSRSPVCLGTRSSKRGLLHKITAFLSAFSWWASRKTFFPIISLVDTKPASPQIPTLLADHGLTLSSSEGAHERYLGAWILETQAYLLVTHQLPLSNRGGKENNCAPKFFCCNLSSEKFTFSHQIQQKDQFFICLEKAPFWMSLQKNVLKTG